MPAPVATITLDLDAPLDLPASLGPLVRGHGDRTIRVARDRACWATRTAAGPATVGLTVGRGQLRVDAWGSGADIVLDRMPRLFSGGTDGLADAADPRIAALSRRRPGVRILRTGAVMESLIAAILEQKVTGTAAHRAWHVLVRRQGDVAPGPAVVGLRVLPAPATLAALPYWAYHPLGLERRRADLIRAISREAAAFERLADGPLPAA